MATTVHAAKTPLRVIVAGNVRAFIAWSRLTQGKVAAMLGWKQQYLSRRLTGEVPFDVTDLEALADVFDVEVQEFFRDSPVKYRGILLAA